MIHNQNDLGKSLQILSIHPSIHLFSLNTPSWLFLQSNYIYELIYFMLVVIMFIFPLNEAKPGWLTKCSISHTRGEEIICKLAV